jgi:hypothetical protein
VKLLEIEEETVDQALSRMITGGSLVLRRSGMGVGLSPTCGGQRRHRLGD